MENKAPRVILDLCGGTGSWSRPYEEAGYDVFNITLPHYDITLTEIYDTGKHGMITFRPPNGGQGEYIRARDIHGILAAPPCTMFSIARTRAKKPRDFDGAMQIVQACMRIIWACRSAGSLEWWAMENPTGMLRQFLGIPAYRFMQWQYGGLADKPTDIWGYFKIPTPTHKIRPATAINMNLNPRWTHPEIPAELKPLGIRAARAAVRAITPPGFARAFFLANP